MNKAVLHGCAIFLAGIAHTGLAQNVGIGVTNPTTPLQVASGPGQFSPAAISILPTTHATSNRAAFDIDDWALLQDFAGNGVKNFAIYQKSAGLQRIIINPAGYVGIGTLNPLQHLHIAGNTQIDGNSYMNGRAGVNQFFTNVTFNLRAAAAGERIFNVVNSTGATSLFSVGPAGDVIGDGTLEVGRGLVVDAKAANTGTIANGIRLGGAGSGEGIGSKRNAGTGQNGINFYTANTQRATILNNGNVGIGTLNPLQHLHIAGNTQIDGNSYMNGRAGVNQFFSNVTFNLRAAAAGERIFNVVNSTGATSLFSVGPAGDVIGDGNLEVGQGLLVDAKAANTGTITNGIRLGGAGSGEGIGSKRNAGTGQYGISFYTANTQRATILNNGNVGIGTTNPGAVLHVQSSTGQVIIRRTSATGADNLFASYPLFVDGGNQGILIKLGDASVNRTNNFMMFADANNIVKGRIEGFRKSDYSPPSPVTNPGGFICYVNELLGPIPLDPLSAITAAASIAIAIDCLDDGITYASGFGDYAEYLEMENPGEKMTFGDIVGVKAGKVSKNTRDAEQVMAVSLAPIVLGNAPPHDSVAYRYQKIAFMGQLPVKISGAVKSGDFIVASGMNNGIGFAVSPEKMTLDYMGRIVGRAWETSDATVTRFIKVVVGLKGNEVEAVMREYQARLSGLESNLAQWKATELENQELKAELAQLNATLEARMKALENRMEAIQAVAVANK